MADRPPAPAARRPAVRPSSTGSGEGVDARAAALALMQAALARRGGLDDGWGDEADGLDARDRGLARAIAGAALRHLGLIDRLLAARLAKAPPPEVTDLLRLGAAQLLALRAPPFAAVSTTVELAARAPATRPFKGLVNAVLRGLDRDGGPALLDALPATAALPDWLAARWTAAWGAEAVVRMADRLLREPPTDLTPRDPADAAALAAELEAHRLSGGSLRLERRGDLAGWPGYGEGRWWVQDAAAAWPARMLDVRPGETALDLCAAPGGKTLQLAAAGARVVALDRSSARLERVAQNLARTGLTAETVAADAAAWEDPRTFDAVLLDAPCSATGTFRRHPDVLWATRPGDIAKLASVQSALLDAAARRVRPGGRLVYCTCSLEPEEGEAQVAPFLARHPAFRLSEVAPGWPGAVAAAGGWRFSPGAEPPAEGCDGFFVARFDHGG